MLTLAHCIVCKQFRGGKQRWGVPICGGSNCIEEWKFGFDQWVYLYQELDLQVKKAEFNAHKESKTPPTLPGFIATGKIASRMWCDLCQMFRDNEAHEGMHRQNLLKGEDVQWN
jgi:hypothetical protein